MRGVMKAFNFFLMTGLAGGVTHVVGWQVRFGNQRRRLRVGRRRRRWLRGWSLARSERRSQNKNRRRLERQIHVGP